MVMQRIAEETGIRERIDTMVAAINRTLKDEMARNPRARSARLRAAERTEAPARPDGDPLAYGVPQLSALAQFMARA